MVNGKCTGNRRYRIEKRRFRDDLVVLQVEVEWGEGPDDWRGMPEYMASKGWRDALPSDFLNGELHGN